jgi:hypothetical protein
MQRITKDGILVSVVNAVPGRSGHPRDEGCGGLRLLGHSRCCGRRDRYALTGRRRHRRRWDGASPAMSAAERAAGWLCTCLVANSRCAQLAARYISCCVLHRSHIHTRDHDQPWPPWLVARGARGARPGRPGIRNAFSYTRSGTGYKYVAAHAAAAAASMQLPCAAA